VESEKLEIGRRCIYKL